MKVTARTNLHGHELTDIPVLNPGGWFGKTCCWKSVALIRHSF